ncbi:hypothetical protein R1sor_024400 [Riccia sorocarpa]|uniref:Early light-induced protein n=1 Tax=Riccia sorocarpa TaxID=122646 RepID=A0ABD3GUE2_9MARC
MATMLSATSCRIASPSSLLGKSCKPGTELNRIQGLPQLLSTRRRLSTTKLIVHASQQQEKSGPRPPLSAQQQKGNVEPPLPGTKVDVTEEQVKKNEQEEPLRVFDQTAAGRYFRPESERRPEMGNNQFPDVMRFDGPAPETINGRLAMLGITWAFAAEIMGGQSVVQQVVNGTGLIWFLVVAPIFIWASFVPIFGWNESPDSRKFGPFNAKAERWNGRAAMIGFLSLIITEQVFVHGPLFGFLHH